MGNHVAGRAMGMLAEEAIRNRQSGESALSILDRICTPYSNTHLDWKAEDPARPGRVHPDYGSYTDPHPKAALGMLILEAFAPNGVADLHRYAPMLDAEHPDESAYDAWWTEVYEPFQARYNFS